MCVTNSMLEDPYDIIENIISSINEEEIYERLPKQQTTKSIVNAWKLS